MTLKMNQNNFWTSLVFLLLFNVLSLPEIDCACTAVRGKAWAEKCLFDDLIVNSGYEALVVPRHNTSEPLVAQLGFGLRGLTSINEKDEVMTVIGSFTAVWVDPYLSWDPDDYDGVEQIVFKTEKIWYPDIAISNSANSFYDDKFSKQFRVLVYSDGTVIWSFGAQFAVACSLDITYYPFDIQECKIDVENWAYEENDVDLVAIDWNDGSGVDISQLEAHPLWNLDGTWGRVTTSAGKDAAFRESLYPKVSFFFRWQRKTQFYIYNFIIPSAFLTLIALGTFWLPSDCGEKISFGITVMLSFTVYQVILMDSIPVNSENTPVLNTLLIAMITGALLSLLTSMLSVYISGKGSVHPVPPLLRKIFLEKLACALCVLSHARAKKNQVGEVAEVYEKLSIQEIVSCNGTGSDVSMKGTPKLVRRHEQKDNGELLLLEVRKLTGFLKQKESDDEVAEEWKHLAKVIDRLLFWLYLLAYVIFYITFAVRVVQNRSKSN